MALSSYRRRFSFLILCFAVLGVGQSNAQYVVNGNATELSCNCFRLTEDDVNQHGSVWNLNQIDLTQPFEMTFRIYSGDDDGWGADGMSFVLQQGTSSTAQPHGNPGHQFIVPSVAIEIDQYMDVENNDPGDDHVAIMANGSYDHDSADNLAGPIDAIFLGGNVDDGEEHDLRISWDPVAQNLTVYFDVMFLPLLVYNGDIVTTIFGGDPMVYWGFTGGTGGIPSEHWFCSDLESEASTSATAICQGGEIEFTSTATSSLSNIENWNWNFDNGQTSADPNPVMTFDTVGTYAVVQTVSDISGCIEENILNIMVEPAPNANVQVTSGCEDEDLEISNLTTGAQTFQWTFSDGQSSFVTNPTLTPASGGAQWLTLVAVSEIGCIDSTTVSFFVNPTPTVTMSMEDHCLGEEISYTVNASVANGQIDSVHWNMDDGTTYSDLNISHVYQQSGIYSVEVEVFSDSGCSNLVAVNVEVFGLMPNIQVNIDTLSVSNGPFVAYQWYINEVLIVGATSDTFIPDRSGNITVIATDNSGCAVSSFNIEYTSPTGIRNPEWLQEIGLLPNPNRGTFALEAVFNQRLSSHISITDALGREVASFTQPISAGVFRRTFQLRGLQSGMYHLSLTTEKGTVVRPFVISE